MRLRTEAAQRRDQLEEPLGLEVGADAADARPEAVAEVAREQGARDGIEVVAALEVAPQRGDLAERLRPAVGGVGDDIAPERFLELIAALRGVRS